MREGRSPKWKRFKKITSDLISRRRQVYMDSQRMVLLEDDGERSFYKNVRSNKSPEKPKQFNVRDILIGKTNEECSEALADHFNPISNKFQALEPSGVPFTWSEGWEPLLPFQVAGRLRAFRKPKSMVRGDLFPKLVMRCADLLAVPLTDIYTEITHTGIWPLLWKWEHVTAIHKCSIPTSLNDLRNIPGPLWGGRVWGRLVLKRE